ncbi:uncharacterized protein LOC109927510 [Rhincodon typus]|uniref:uncharacterized protein LOC109927510 n=1 Tax=Rhincodon typus TaxID=259920 RepID=UPI0009A31D47|nr:uncharacterized protein LOC109927510 [Rhincodon typus]
MQLSKGGVRSEAALSLSHVQKVLEAMKSGTNLNHVLLASCYVSDKKYISIVEKIWQENLKEHTQEDQIYGETKSVSGLLIVAVFPHLPKDAAVEWHVIAVTDDPCERKSFIISKKSDGYAIDCEVIVSSLKSSAAISLAVSLLPPSVNSLNLKSMLHELAVVFRQAMDKLPQDVKQLPLCFKTFYCEDVIDPSFVQTDLERFLEDILDLKFPLLILVPAADLPGLEILHVSCWLSS